MGRDLDIKMRGYIPDPFEFICLCVEYEGSG